MNETEFFKSEVIAAIVAAGTSIVLAIVSLIQSNSQGKKLEILKSELANEKAEKDARLDYEYEARKRLYNEYSPLFFQFSGYAELAFNHIKALSWSPFKGLKNKRHWDRYSWMKKDSYFFRETIYKLFCPLVIYKLLLNKVTFLDLSLDKKVLMEFNLCKILYFSFQRNYIIAQLMSDKILIQEEHKKIYNVVLKYDETFKKAYAEVWQQNLNKDPEKFEQGEGIRTGRLDSIIEAFLEDEKIISFSDFEKRIIDNNSFDKRLEILEERFRNFDPKVHKILWRTLVAQSAIYFLFQKIRTQDDVSIDDLIDYCKDYFKDYKDQIENPKKPGFKANIEDPIEQLDILNSAEKFVVNGLRYL